MFALVWVFPKADGYCKSLILLFWQTHPHLCYWIFTNSQFPNYLPAKISQFSEKGKCFTWELMLMAMASNCPME